MIEYVRGELAELTPAYAVVEAHGVGYGLSISLNTYSGIQNKKEVKQLHKLLVKTVQLSKEIIVLSIEQI